jgi:hypothetical protein
VLLYEGCLDIIIDVELWWNAEGAFDAFPYELGVK